MEPHPSASSSLPLTAWKRPRPGTALPLKRRSLGSARSRQNHAHSSRMGRSTDQEDTMNPRNIFSLSAIAASGLAMLPGNAVAQTESLKDQLVGTWALVSYQSTATDGTKSAVFGAQPKGILMINAGGHYAMVLTDPGRAKWKSNLRTQLSTE